MTESFRFAFCCVVLLCFVETIIQKRTRVTFYCVNLIEDFDKWHPRWESSGFFKHFL